MEQPDNSNKVGLCTKVSYRHVLAWSIGMLAVAGWLAAAFLIRQTLHDDSHHSPAVEGCNKKARDNCQDNIEGNHCVETDRFPFYRCNCTAHGYAVHDEHFCLAVLCVDWDDLFACKVDIEGNTCRMDRGVLRNCSCNAPGYQLKESGRGDICWRIQCTSYEEDQCHIEENGNTCAVLDDVFQCTCNAPGYTVEPGRNQRCLPPITTYPPWQSTACRHTAGFIEVLAILTAFVATKENW